MVRYLLIIGICGLIANPFAAGRKLNAQQGASLYVSPASGSFAVGSTFTVSVFLNTGGRNVNAVEADLKFPADKLQVVSPTAGSSFVAVWVAQPTFSNARGTLNFKGGVPSPGINTDAGLISTVTFRVRTVGIASITFTDQSKVLLDDGKGTNILSTTAGATYNLILPPPEGPPVSSATHPDQGKWYRNENPSFSWERGEEIRGFSYLLNKEPVDIPDDISEGSATQVSYKNIGDGSWFFHLKALGPTGWGGVTHFGVNIDTTPPAAFSIGISPRKRTVIRQPFISFNTTDQTSGVDYYEIKLIKVGTAGVVTENDIREAQAQLTPFFIEATSPYQAPLLARGAYDIIVRAYDRAGNFQESVGKLQIVNALFAPFGKDGLLIRGALIISWTWLWIIGAVILILLLYLAYRIYRAHREVHLKLEKGVWSIGHKVSDDREALVQKRKEYGQPPQNLIPPAPSLPR
jgi:hypothetical protein